MKNRYLLILLFFASSPIFANNYDELTSSLVDLRGSVESLNQTFQVEKGEAEQRLKSQGLMIADLEAQIRREENTKEQTRARLNELEAQLQDNRVSRDEYRTALAEIERMLTNDIVPRIPFYREQRQDVVSEITKKYHQGRLSEEQALSQYWQFIEDEMRLSKENGLYQSVVELEGQQQRVEVAKIGSLLFYFKTLNGDVGFLTGHGPELIKARDEQEKVLMVFESLKKQIRTGEFDLPYRGREVNL